MIIEKQNEDLRDLNQKLVRACEIDPLTNIYNRRKFHDYAKSSWKIAGMQNLLVSLLMIDIDFFKDYNDFYGHVEGDLCLVKITKVLRKIVHEADGKVFRYGGEEFVVILPDLPKDDAVLLAEKIRKAIVDLKIINESRCKKNIVTVSIGVHSKIPGKDDKFWDFVSETDQSLYVAKRMGRNMVIHFDSIKKINQQEVLKA